MVSEGHFEGQANGLGVGEQDVVVFAAAKLSTREASTDTRARFPDLVGE